MGHNEGDDFHRLTFFPYHLFVNFAGFMYIESQRVVYVWLKRLREGEQLKVKAIILPS